ncbi:MAG: chloride channel protein [Enterococcus sp.]
MKITKKILIKDLISLIILGFFIGGVVGSIDALFGRVLLFLSDVRVDYFNYLIFFLAPAGMLFTYFFLKYGKSATKGMGLIFQVGFEEEEAIPKRLVPFIMIGTWMTHLFGGSAGREGVAVQLGATVANWFGRFANIPNRTSVFLVTGMAAGFAGLFETPIAAIFFALEVLVIGNLKYEALLTSMIAAFTASYVSHSLGLEKFAVDLAVDTTLDPLVALKLVGLGIIFGLVGLSFTFLLKKAKQLLVDKIENPILRIGLVGLAVSILLFLFWHGRYSGLGTNLISASFANDPIYNYDWLLKLVLTVITLAAGFQGGEVTPLFAIGASLGLVLGSLFSLPVTLVAALGYAAVFGSATNTLLAPIFIGAEVFGFEYLPFFFITCSVAYLCNLNQSIYGAQRKML